MKANRDDRANEGRPPRGVAGNPTAGRALFLLGLAALCCLSAPLGALDAETGVYAGASLGYGGCFLLPYEQYRYDVHRFDTHGGQETNLLPPLPDGMEAGLRLGYRTEIAAFELTAGFGHLYDYSDLLHEVDGEQIWLSSPRVHEAGITGKFYALDIHGSIHPFLGFSLLFRQIKVPFGSIHWEGVSYSTDDASYRGYGYAIVAGADIGLVRKLWLTVSAAYGWHRYLWVEGALGEATPLADPLRGSSWSVSALAATTLCEIPKRPRRR